MASLKDYLFNLNAFEPDPDSGETETEREHRLNIIATRIYLLLLALLLIIFTVFLLVSAEITLVSVDKPTEEQFQALPADTQCFCSRISTAYGDFVSFQPVFHQVCASDFVSDAWIKAIFNGSNPTSFYYKDFRISGSAQFQALASFCALSEVTALQSIATFGAETLISATALSQRFLQSKTQAAVEQSQSLAYQTFASELQVIRNMMRTSQQLSALQTSTMLFYLQGLNGDGIDGVYLNENSYLFSNGSTCSCLQSLDCQYSTSIYDLFGPRDFMDDLVAFRNLMDIPGIVGGCLPVDGMLRSTLQCLYNQTCVDDILSLLSPLNNFTAMKTMAKSRFNSSTTVQSIVEYLMVEDWGTNISYEKYYHQCAPNLCTYSTPKHNDFIFVLAKLIGSLGGLILLLKLLIPPLLRFIQRPQNNEPTARISLSVRIRQLWMKMKKMIVELNLFKQYPSSDRPVRYQRQASRLYLLLIVLSLLILTFYSSLTTVVRRETIDNPTESQYNHSQQNHRDSLSCPCNTTLMAYLDFITMRPLYHQFCSSDLVSARWMNYLQAAVPWYPLNTAGSRYKYYGSTHFRLLSQFCQQSERTIDDALPVFLQRQFVSSQVIPPTLFNEEINLLIQNWQATITNQFLRTIRLFRAISQANQLTDGRSNVDWTIVNLTTLEPGMSAKMYSNCTCGLSQSCRSTMVLYDINDDRDGIPVRFRVPNFFADCFPVEGLLASTLECYYNRSCMLAIHQWLVPNANQTAFDFLALDSSRSEASEVVKAIINRLMVDSWQSDVSFSSYYGRCAPSSCTFEYRGRNNVVVIITTVLSIFSGLSLAYKLLLLILLQLIEKMSSGFSCVGMKQLIKNLFSCHDEHQTIDRLHVLFVVISLGILYSFISFTPQSIVAQVPKPTLSTYMNLLASFPVSLQCPCAEISISQNLFLNITPRFHQVCSSDFVSDDWISYLHNESNSIDHFVPNDYRSAAREQFQMLASFCQLCQETAHTLSLQFLEGSFISNALLSSKSLNESITTNLHQFRITVPNLFLSTLSLIHQMTGANVLMSALATSWKYINPDYAVPGSATYTAPVVYEECNCGTSMKCLQPYGNMLKGCYLLEALFQWPLHCLYEQQCIDPAGTFTAMNTSASSFSTNATVETIVSQLMVEDYSMNISYENYFAKCSPSSCGYTYIDKNNVVDGMTNLIALYGGLVILCRVLAIIAVKIFWCPTTRIVPVLN